MLWESVLQCVLIFYKLTLFRQYYSLHTLLSTTLKHLTVQDLKDILCHRAMPFAVLKGIFIYYHRWETAYTYWMFSWGQSMVACVKKDVFMCINTCTRVHLKVYIQLHFNLSKINTVHSHWDQTKATRQPREKMI